MALHFDTPLRALMAENLGRFSRRPIELDGRRAAAVAIVIAADDEGRACYLITRRAASLRSHAGQLSLPGGRIDAGESALQAALRETHEEIGLTVSQDSVLGTLDDFATRSGYVITPIVVWADNADDMVANPAEVARIHSIPLDTMDHPDVPELLTIPESDQPVLLLPFLGGHLNPPTAAVVWQLFEVAVHGRATRVAHYEQPVWAWR